jgi:hypothetical protein
MTLRVWDTAGREAGRGKFSVFILWYYINLPLEIISVSKKYQIIFGL